MNKKTIAVNLMVLALPLILSSCGKTAASSSSSSAPASSSSSSATSSKTSSASSSKTSSASSSSSSSSSSAITLDTPVLTVDGRTASWTAIKGASLYKVFVDDDTTGIATEETSYTVPYGATLTHTVKVQAFDDEEHASPLSEGITTTAAGVSADSWADKDAILADWEVNGAYHEGTGEGVDLGEGIVSMSVAKAISAEKPTLRIVARCFGGQEGTNGTGPVGKVTINGTALSQIERTNDTFTLPLADSSIPYYFDVSEYAGQSVVIMISGAAETNFHLVIQNVELGTSTWTSDTDTDKFVWGHNYTDNWGGEMGNSCDHPYRTISDEWEFVGEGESINEGMKLQKNGAITRYLAITDDNLAMTIDTRSFGDNYRGAVYVNDEIQTPIGATDSNYFTRDGYAGYKADAEDGCMNAVITMYSLAGYIGQTVKISIVNAGNDDYGEDMVIGSVAFDGAWSLSSDALTFDATTLNSNDGADILTNLAWAPAGVAGIYNEGLNFRTQDFASGISKIINLTGVSAGTAVTLEASFRSFGGDGAATIEFWRNGAKDATDNTYPESSEETMTYSYDLTSLDATYAAVYFRIPSRNYRIVLQSITLKLA